MVITGAREQTRLEPSDDTAQIVERIAALEIGKAEISCWVRVPDPDRPGGCLQEVAASSTMTRSLLGLRDRPAGLGDTRALMEVTPAVWRNDLDVTCSRR
jgi:hypothetical protein